MNQFLFKYIDNKASKTLILLHGTGGNENDFLFLDPLIGKSYNFLGLRGNVNEGGMNRFFRRLSFGNFDQENIKEEVEKLKEFIDIWIKEHKIAIEDLIFLGYSNGANMILATLFYHPELVKNAILLHPMLPFEPKNTLNLSKNNILMTYGVNDTMIPLSESLKVIEILKSYRAQLIVDTYQSGHEVSDKEMSNLLDYLTS